MVSKKVNKVVVGAWDEAQMQQALEMVNTAVAAGDKPSVRGIAT